MIASPRRKLLLLSGLFLSVVAAAAAGCSGDDSGAPADSGADGAVAPGPDSSSGEPDSSSGPDANGKDTGGPGIDSGVHPDGSAEAGSDTGAPDGGGTDAGTDSGTPDSGTPDSGGTDGGGADSGDAAANVPNDPIAVWNFDEGSGSLAFDSSGHAHTATLLGGATFGPGKHGTGLSPNAAGWAVVPATLPDAGIADAGSSGDAADGSAADADTDAGATDADVADSGDAEGDATSDAGGMIDAGPSFAPLVFDTTKSFSVVCWVKVYSSGPNQWQTAFSRDGTNLSVFTLKLRGDSPAPAPGEQFDFDFPGADNTSTGVYTVAQSATSPASSLLDGGADHWYHLAGVLNRDPADAGAATVQIYVNGSAEATAMPGANPILAAVGDTIIGATLFNGRTGSWNGVIDDVSLYDRALSAAEVSALYETTK